MLSQVSDPSRINWPVQLYAALIALVFFVAIGLCQADVSLFLYLFVVGPVLFVSSILLLLCVAISKNRRRYMRLLPTLVIFWAISAAFFTLDHKYPIAIRSAARWHVWFRDYKAQVLGQTLPPSGELRRIEWDEWGMFGQNTSVYLVFDPTDSLSDAARSHQPGKFNGIPCRVPLVRRLEANWYAVFAYTNQDPWGECN